MHETREDKMGRNANLGLSDWERCAIIRNI